MKKPTNNLSSRIDGSLARELIFLYIATVFFQVYLIDTNLMTAVFIAPVIMLGLTIAIYLSIEILWLASRAVDRIFSQLHIGRS